MCTCILHSCPPLYRLAIEAKGCKVLVTLTERRQEEERRRGRNTDEGEEGEGEEGEREG